VTDTAGKNLDPSKRSLVQSSKNTQNPNSIDLRKDSESSSAVKKKAAVFDPDALFAKFLEKNEVDVDGNSAIAEFLDEYVKGYVAQQRGMPDFKDKRRWSILCLLQDSLTAPRRFDSDIAAGKFLDQELREEAQHAALGFLLEKGQALVVCEFLTEQVKSKTMSSAFVTSLLTQIGVTVPGEIFCSSPLKCMLFDVKHGAKATISGLAELLRHLKNPLKLVSTILSEYGARMKGSGLSKFEYLMDCIGGWVDKEELRGVLSGRKLNDALSAGSCQDVEVWASIYRKAGFSSSHLVDFLMPRGSLKEMIKKGNEEVLKTYANVLFSIQGDKSSKLEKKHAALLLKAIRAEHMGAISNITAYEKMDKAVLEHFRAAKNTLKPANYG